VPIVKRSNKPDLYYELDDYTDPWKKAPHIVLQHGFGRSSKFWYRWVPYLSRFYKVVRPDLRGFGRSGRNFDYARDLNTAEYVADVEAILDHIGAERVHYCGESLGGIIGQIFAAERPHRMRTLSIVSSPVFLNADFMERSKFGFETWEEAMRKLGAKGYALAKNKGDRFSRDTDTGLMQWFADEQGSSDVEVMIAVQKTVARLSTEAWLPRIEAPMLAIYPSEGPITSPEQEALLRKHVRNLTLVHLASRHHNLHLIKPAECAQHVLYFAAQQDGVSCRE
jgi:3-oxoadipate enol-lactonase